MTHDGWIYLARVRQMAVPRFDEFFLPFLLVLKEHDRLEMGAVKTLIAERMGLSEEDQRELLPSGRQRRYDNRVGWARTYLAKAGLVKVVTRGVYELTPTGREFITRVPDVVNVDTLRQLEKFREWHDSPRVQEVPEPVKNGGAETPEELIDVAYQELRENLATELAEALQTVSWQRFEEVVIDVLLALGYGGSRVGAGRAFRKSGDGGVDGVIDEDRLGLSKIYVQAKRYAPDRRISRPDIQAFVGSLLGQKARQGVFITTSDFTREAIEYAEGLSDLRVVLISGEELAGFMIDHDVGVSEHDRFVIKRLDRDYFEEL